MRWTHPLMLAEHIPQHELNKSPYFSWTHPPMLAEHTPQQVEHIPQYDRSSKQLFPWWTPLLSKSLGLGHMCHYQIPLRCWWSTNLYGILYWRIRVRKKLKNGLPMYPLDAHQLYDVTDKTEMIVFSPTRGPTPQSIHLKWGNDIIPPVKEVKNLRVIFDEKN